MKIIWLTWLITIGVSFAAFEWYALAHNTTTLSRFVWEISAAWPPFGYIVGFITGFLACHFWWGGIISFDPVKKK